MSRPYPPSHPNLPRTQRITQLLVDQFNTEEQNWRERMRRTLAGLLRRFASTRDV